MGRSVSLRTDNLRPTLERGISSGVVGFAPCQDLPSTSASVYFRRSGLQCAQPYWLRAPRATLIFPCQDAVRKLRELSLGRSRCNVGRKGKTPLLRQGLRGECRCQTTFCGPIGISLRGTSQRLRREWDGGTCCNGELFAAQW